LNGGVELFRSRTTQRFIASPPSPSTPLGAGSCKERKDGAPTVMVAQASIVQRAWPPANTGHRWNALILHLCVGRVGVLRLRGWFASRTSHFAQDDRVDLCANLRASPTLYLYRKFRLGRRPADAKSTGGALTHSFAQNANEWGTRSHAIISVRLNVFTSRLIL